MSKHSPWLRVPASEYDGHMGHESVGQTDALNRLFADLLQKYPPKKGICVLGCATGNGFEHIPNDKMVRVVGVDINLNYLHLVRERHGERLRWLELQCRDVLRCDFPDQAFDHIYAALLFEYTDPAAALKRIRPWLTDGGVLSVVLQLQKSNVPYHGLKSVVIKGTGPLSADDPDLRASRGKRARGKRVRGKRARGKRVRGKQSTYHGLQSVVREEVAESASRSDAGKVSESPFDGVKILHDVIHLITPEDFAMMAKYEGLGLVSSERIPLPQGKAFEVMVFQDK